MGEIYRRNAPPNRPTRRGANPPTSQPAPVQPPLNDEAAHPLDQTAATLAGIDAEAFLRPERGVVPTPQPSADPTGWAEFTGYVPPAAGVPLAEHAVKLTPVFADQLQQPYAPPPAADRVWDAGLYQALQTAVDYTLNQNPDRTTPRRPNLDPGFADLVNQTYTPAPGLRDNFTGPTEGAFGGAAPPPDGVVYPWQTPADAGPLTGVAPG